jgi:putative transposase
MPRLPRLQYPGAIYHLVTRGDGRRKLFHDQGHYERFTKGLQDEVDRSGWVVLAYCWMPNHIHALIKTPEPNLCRGMQHWLSGYANWYAKRNRRTGHLFQGRYKAFPVEDEGYYWNLSRYIHLNPCNGGKPLAGTPEEYPHSSYGGYARKSRQVDWVAYEEHHRYWVGRNGGQDPGAAYRRFVKEGLNNPVDSSLDRLRDWVYGGEDFLKQVLAMAAGDDPLRNRRRIRRATPVDVQSIISATAASYQVDPEEYVGFRSGAAGRDLAAYLCRRYTRATLRELSERFGLSHPDSASDLVRRGAKQAKQSQKAKHHQKEIESKLGLNPESRD